MKFRMNDRSILLFALQSCSFLTVATVSLSQNADTELFSGDLNEAKKLSIPFASLMTKLMEGGHGDDDNTSKSKQSVVQPAASIRGITLPTPSTTQPAMKICEKRRKTVNDILVAKGYKPLSKEDLVEICTQPIDSADPNLSCPFLYVIGEDNGFSKGNLQFYMDHLTPDIPLPDVFHATELFCECYHGYELGCATKIPRQGNDLAGLGNSGAATKWMNYCKVAGVWNGDYETSDVFLSSEMKECGCYFIGQAREFVNECPGVDLGFSQR